MASSQLILMNFARKFDNILIKLMTRLNLTQNK